MVTDEIIEHDIVTDENVERNTVTYENIVQGKEVTDECNTNKKRVTSGCVNWYYKLKLLWPPDQFA